MTDSENYVLDCIRHWIWSGFYTEDQIESMIDDVVDGDCDVEMLKSRVAPEFASKLEAEAEWPDTTDCDRLDLIFQTLEERGICAVPNAGYTMSEGHTEVAEAMAAAPNQHYTGYCFYHGQDIERSIDGGGIMLAFGAFSDAPEQSIAIGRVICEELRQQGFTVDWNGSRETRISVPQLVWHKRAIPSTPYPCDAGQVTHPGQVAKLIQTVFDDASEHPDEPHLCVTLEATEDNDIWIQIIPDALNMAYPFSAHPQNTLDKILCRHPAAQLQDWEENKYATWSFNAMAATELANIIDELARSVFKLDGSCFNASIERL